MLGRLLVALVVLASALAGCLQPSGSLQAASVASAPVAVRDANGTAVPYAAVDLLQGGKTVASLSTGANGTLDVPAVAFDAARVWAAGYAPASVTRSALLAGVTLSPEATPLAANDTTPGLRLLPPHELGYDTDIPAPACAAADATRGCGLSEPVVEVAGDGSVYASATCCVGPSPPVWVSRDGGITWQRLATPGVREAAGIEGDFAIDDAGNVYFTDILVGAGWFTSWDATGSWRDTVPVPLEPLVDRPWVRAGPADEAYFLYNTGSQSNFLRSTDGGKTWGVPLMQFPCGLGALGQGPERNHLWVTSCLRLYESKDGGSTWKDVGEVPKPKNATDKEGQWIPFAVPVVDENGTVLVTYDWGSKETGFVVYGAFRSPEGEWRLTAVSPTTGTHHMPWPAAGKGGGFAVAWYGTDGSRSDPDHVNDTAPWYADLAVTRDAGLTWQTVHADPKPVITGPINRKLLDFVQVDVMPDGAVALVYAEARVGQSAPERTHFVRTTAGLDLAPLKFPNGPHAVAKAGAGLLGLR